MISQANKEIIATVLNVTVDELSGALSSENEVTLDLRLNGRVLSQEDERSLKEGAIQQGKEIGFKEVAKGLSIELASGEKDPAIIAEKLKSTISASLEDKYKNMTPTDELIETKEQLKQWENKYNKLNETYEGTTTQVQELENKYNQKVQEVTTKEINNNILKSFPDKMKVDRNDALIIARNAFEFEATDSGIVAKQNGNLVLDALGKPAELDTVIKSFVETKEWIKGRGMNGGDRGQDSGLPKGLSDEDAMKYIQESGKDPMSQEGSKMMIELTSS